LAEITRFLDSLPLVASSKQNQYCQVKKTLPDNNKTEYNMRIKILLILLLLQITQISIAQNSTKPEKISVLNFATFHLSNTTDAYSSPVDINNPSVQQDVDKIVQKLVEFKPTIICIEVPKENSKRTLSEL
jgi:small-conductance mechanosensitive channel